MNKLLQFFALTLIITGAISTIDVEFGSSASVQAYTQTTIQIGGILGPELVIMLDRSANVTCVAFLSVTVSLPEGYESLSFGTEIGFAFDIEPSNAIIIQASLSTPALSLSSIALLTGNVQAGCLEFDGSAYSQVSVAVYDSISKQITVNLPAAGTYIFVGIQTGSVIPSFFDRAQQLVQGIETFINYTGSFFLNVTADTTTYVTVNHSSNNPTNQSDPSNKISLDAYFTIELSSSANVNATLSYAYSQAFLIANDITESTLEFGYATINGWSFEGNTQVDASANIVSQSVNHFSTWGVYGTGNSAPSTSASSTSVSSTSASSTSSTSSEMNSPSVANFIIPSSFLLLLGYLITF